jgi:chemotaxis protein CheZ
VNAATCLATDTAEREGLADALRQALAAVESHDAEALKAATTALDHWLSRPLCRTLAAVDRDLRAALGAAPFEDRLSALAGHDLPDAATRLDTVVELTERAAHTTLDIADALRAEIGALASLGLPEEHAARMRAMLNELQQAQAYQDLTGQVIRHVVGVMQRAEGALRTALVAAGIQPADPGASRAPEHRVLSGVDRGASTQSDADDLLADLGL